MSNKRENQIIQSGIVLEKKQIANHTFYLKIQSDDFSQMEYVAGYTVDIFIGNPFTQVDCEDRKYSFWNYEAVYQIADFAICTFSEGIGAEWIKTLQQGDKIYFKPPRGKLLVDDSAENYLLIGDITSLSHLYEINRNLPFNKNIFSFIYSAKPADIFPDIDQSYPFEYYIVNPVSAYTILNMIKDRLPTNLENTIAYIFGHPETCITLHNYLKKTQNLPIENLRTKPFWKTEKEKTTK